MGLAALLELGFVADKDDVPAVGTVIRFEMYSVLGGFGKPEEIRSVSTHGPDPILAPPVGHTCEDDPPAVRRVLRRCRVARRGRPHESARVGAVDTNSPDRRPSRPLGTRGLLRVDDPA